MKAGQSLIVLSDCGERNAQRLTQEYKLIPALEKNLKLTHLESLSELEATKLKIFHRRDRKLALKQIDE
jgi:hypothetical protein